MRRLWLILVLIAFAGIVDYARASDSASAPPSIRAQSTTGATTPQQASVNISGNVDAGSIRAHTVYYDVLSPPVSTQCGLDAGPCLNTQGDTSWIQPTSLALGGSLAVNTIDTLTVGATMNIGATNAGTINIGRGGQMVTVQNINAGALGTFNYNEPGQICTGNSSTSFLCMIYSPNGNVQSYLRRPSSAALAAIAFYDSTALNGFYNGLVDSTNDYAVADFNGPTVYLRVDAGTGNVEITRRLFVDGEAQLRGTTSMVDAGVLGNLAVNSAGSNATGLLTIVAGSNNISNLDTNSTGALQLGASSTRVYVVPSLQTQSTLQFNGGATASGSNAFDLSSGTGTFATTTGAGTYGGPATFTAPGVSATFNNDAGVLKNLDIKNSISINGSAGTTGQVLTSAGGGVNTWGAAPVTSAEHDFFGTVANISGATGSIGRSYITNASTVGASGTFIVSQGGGVGVATNLVVRLCDTATCSGTLYESCVMACSAAFGVEQGCDAGTAAIPAGTQQHLVITGACTTNPAANLNMHYTSP